MVYGEVAGSVQGQQQTPLSKRPQFKSLADWQAYAKKLNGFAAYVGGRMTTDDKHGRYFYQRACQHRAGWNTDRSGVHAGMDDVMSAYWNLWNPMQN